MTQYHQVPTSTASYWPSTTKYHPVPPFFDPVPSYINVPRDNVLCNNVPYDIVPCNIVPRDIFYNRTKQKKRIIIQIRDLHCLLGLVLLRFNLLPSRDDKIVKMIMMSVTILMTMMLTTTMMRMFGRECKWQQLLETGILPFTARSGRANWKEDLGALLLFKLLSKRYVIHTRKKLRTK